jgi:hypothetical protein
MALTFRTDELSPAEVSLIAWQFGFHDDDDPFFSSLWHVIDRAWTSDHRAPSDTHKQTEHLKRLAAPGAFPEEVAVFLKFKSTEGSATGCRSCVRRIWRTGDNAKVLPAVRTTQALGGNSLNLVVDRTGRSAAAPAG